VASDSHATTSLLRHESTSNEQAQRLELMTTLIDGLETALTFNLEEHERQFFVSTQDKFKRLLRYWAGDETANIKDDDPFAADRAEALKPEHDAEDTSRGWWNLTPEERKQKMGAGLAAYHTKRRADREAEREEAVAQ
jgi:hypothetical protein